MEFSAFEKGISAFLAKYQNQTVNDFEPFVSVIPTIENITDHFSVQFLSIVSSMGGMLERVEASETPTRTYILEWESEEDGPKAKQVHESAEEPAGGLPGGTAEREEFKEKIRQSAADNIVSAMLGK
jgi:6-pyruvoyl-tetrahydropterin synthase